MKKKSILAVVLLMVVAFAAVATNLLINGSTTIQHDSTEGDVYFNAASTETGGTATISDDKKAIIYTTSDLSSVGDTSILDFQVVNDSTQYDATVFISCRGENGYYTVTPDATSYEIPAQTTKEGEITVRLTSATTNDFTHRFQCYLNSYPKERDKTADYAHSSYAVGDEITIGTENPQTFNVISETFDTVTMLAQYSLGSDYRQTSSLDWDDWAVEFAYDYGWEHTPSPQEIDVFKWSTNPKTYINNYVTYLQEETGDTSITGNLITGVQLMDLGCDLTDYYHSSNINTCTNSIYSNWLVNGQYWWTRSAMVDGPASVMFICDTGEISLNSISGGGGVRPIITIKKSTLENL